MKKNGPKKHYSPLAQFLFFVAGFLPVTMVILLSGDYFGSFSKESTASPSEKNAPASKIPAQWVPMASGQVVKPERTNPDALPKDASAMILREEKADFTVFRLTGGLVNTQTMDVDASDDEVWMATSRGLLRHQPERETWTLFGANVNIPGEWATDMILGDRWAAVDLAKPTRPGCVLGVGGFFFYPDGEVWRTCPYGAPLAYDKGVFYAADGYDGLMIVDLPKEKQIHYKLENSGLLHDTVSALSIRGDEIWIAMRGDYDQKKKDFKGGGISVLNRKTGIWKSYTVRDGLARAYTCDIDADVREVWAVHWEEKIGASVYDRRSRKWRKLVKSANGIDLGGVHVALDGDAVWIGQQGGLVRMNRKTRQAILYTEKDGLPGYIVTGIAVTSECVWAGAYSYGQSVPVSTSGLVRFKRRAG